MVTLALFGVDIWAVSLHGQLYCRKHSMIIGHSIPADAYVDSQLNIHANLPMPDRTGKN